MILTIAGDTVPKPENMDLFIEGNAQKLYGDLPSKIADSDYVIVNLECALTNEEAVIKKYGPGLKADPLAVNGLLALGVTHVCTANNHIYDFGHKGLVDTWETLDQAGIVQVGTGKDLAEARKILYLEKNDVKAAIVNVCEHEFSYAAEHQEGANPYDPYDTMDDIREAKQNADHVIVVYHGGKEHCRYPSPRLRKLCLAMVNAGASTVLCQHSHCIGCVEDYCGAHIVYGQGNFHFTHGYDSEAWNTGMVIKLTLGADSCKIDFIPTVIEDALLRPATEEEGARLLSEMVERSRSLATNEWLEGFRQYVDENGGHYRKVAAEIDFENEESLRRFAHYLDCEAHHDIYCEIFRTWHMDLCESKKK